jgi:microcin C transport system permease protein
VKEYFLRRILLIPPTLFGITVLVFMIMRLAPGGPMEEDLKKLMGSPEGKSTRSREQSGFSLTPEMLLNLAGTYNRDKSSLRHYFEWLGMMPRDTRKSAALFKEGFTTEISLPGTISAVKVHRDEAGKGHIEGLDAAKYGEWSLRIQSPADQARIWRKHVPGNYQMPADTPWRAELYQPSFRGLLQGKLGNSMSYQDPVAGMITQRMPISLFFGIIQLILLYGICLPLGIIKAIKHRTWLDNISSITVFAGYAIPGYALGSLLVVFICAKGWFPMGGLVSDNFSELGTWGQIKDLANHAAMPLVCYMVGSFAMMTMMVKNNLMDHLAADYVRTAVAKGVSFRRAVFGHALRNSLIPIATTIGGVVGIFVGGSMLIEKIFDIDGFGLLQFSALVERDETIIMGTLTISAFLLLVGNIISDFAVAMVDPKISFD